MNMTELVAYLVENLSIKIDTEQWGHTTDKVTVKLFLGENEISSDSFEIKI